MVLTSALVSVLETGFTYCRVWHCVSLSYWKTQISSPLTISFIIFAEGSGKISFSTPLQLMSGLGPAEPNTIFPRAFTTSHLCVFWNP